MELGLQVDWYKDGSFLVHRYWIDEEAWLGSLVFIVREQPWPRKEGNLLW